MTSEHEEEEVYRLTDKGRAYVEAMRKPGIHMDSWEAGYDASRQAGTKELEAENNMLRKAMYLAATDEVFLSLGDEDCFIRSFNSVYHEREKLNYFANCNDTFAPAADCEEMTLQEAAALYDVMVANPKIPTWCHLAKWAQDKRGGAIKSPFLARVQARYDAALASLERSK